MNDIVITYDKTINNEERLRSMLRCIENECEGYNEIYLIGDAPDWIQGVVHIGFSSEESRKDHLRNLFRKIKAATLRQEMTEAFYWIDADDHIPKFDARTALRVSIEESSNFFTNPKGVHKISYEHTKKIMKRRGFLNHNYFNRYPMSMSKKRLNNTFDEVDFETSYGYCIKTLYSNFNRFKPTHDFIASFDLAKYIQPSSYEKKQ